MLDFLYRLSMCSLSNTVSSIVSLVRPVERLALSSCRLVACSYHSHLVPWSVSSGISFLISFYPRAALLIVSSCRLAEVSCLCSSRFLFIRLVSVALRICDEAFLRGACYSYHHDGRAARSLRLVRSLLIRPDGVGGIRARPAVSGHEAMRAARHGEDGDKMS